MDSAVTVTDLVVDRGRRRVLPGLSFAVPTGQVTGLIDDVPSCAELEAAARAFDEQSVRRRLRLCVWPGVEMCYAVSHGTCRSGDTPCRC